MRSGFNPVLLLALLLLSAEISPRPTVAAANPDSLKSPHIVLFMSDDHGNGAHANHSLVKDSDPARAETLSGLRGKLEDWRLQQGENLAHVPMPEDARSGRLRYAN